MNRARLLVVIVVADIFVWANSVPAADTPSPTRPDVNERIVQGLNASLDLGVPIYNRGDHEGCYEIYRGALVALKPLLATGSPDLAQRTQAHLDRAATLRKPSERALELRAAIDEIRWNFRKPLWERLGGEQPVAGIVHDFVTAALADPKVNFTRNGKYPIDGLKLKDMERRLVELISAASGGPLKYTGREMRLLHTGMKITDDEFNAAAADFATALKTNKVAQSDIDELMGIIASTRKDIVEGGAPAAPPPQPIAKKSLWERLGGEAAVKKVVEDVVRSAASDPNVDFTRGGRYKLDADAIAKLQQKLVEFISAKTGGPFAYTGKDMKAVHTGMNITADQFNAMAVDLINSLKKFNVPQPEIDELITIIAGTKKDIVGQ